MSIHLQANRYELKYIISEACAQAIREYTLLYLIPDEHTRDEIPRGYPVNSLYMDGPSLYTYQQTVIGAKNRFKLRIRFYEDTPEAPAFLEIKRRTNNTIQKQRVMVSKTAAAAIAEGGPADLAYLKKQTPANVKAMTDFCRLRDQIQGSGRVFVAYLREAYVSEGSNQLRVTFDRGVVGHPYVPQLGMKLPEHQTKTSFKGVILELKFTDRFPQWMHDLVLTFNLDRTSAPKYLECIDAIGTKPSPWGNQSRGMVS